MISSALTIAGSDPSGGAGIQADLKTFHQFGVYGQAVITLLTVQNTQRVSRVEVMPADLVVEQIRAVLEDIVPEAAKVGALGEAAVVAAVASIASECQFPLVVDPVMISKRGQSLMAEDARAVLCRELLPHVFLLTPNLHEAAAITGRRVESLSDMRVAAEQLVALGATNVLIKGGHLTGPATDLLLAGGEFYEFTSERVETQNTHGTGCTYSAAITAKLAAGTGLIEAVRIAKAYIARAIRTNPGLGKGAGPVNHFA
ncbi:MAG: bifunctional hydroxymethylpyrimidine kinase/phosphomethylpyrimidine kinase [Bryobacteraceae bacterium]